MKNVTITEATGFQPGGVHQMLLNMGVPPIVASLPGESPVRYKTQMNDQQIEHFRLRGFSHRLEVEETPVTDPRDERIARLETERDKWQADAERQMGNTQYYRGLVVRIGEMLGEEAYTQDDGGRVETVLCDKVPGLVSELLDSMAETQYYRGLVVRIGEMLGEEAYTQDDGGRVETVLCDKVPGLVSELLDSMAEAQLMIADLQAKLQAAPGGPAAANAAEGATQTA